MRELSDEKKDKIRFLCGMGFNHWQKKNMNRLYINAEDLGLEIERLAPGVVEATFCGEEIPYREAQELRNAKTFISLPDGKAYSDDIRLQELAQEKFDKVWLR